MGWEGKENGDLLQVMKAEGFDVLITFDKALVKQQNLQGAGVGVVVVCIHPIGYHVLAKMAPEIERVLEFLRPGQIVCVPEKPA
jgi:hypothetical protein